MPEADDLLPPVEIPWKLASTTQPLSGGEPAQTSISLFYFEPDDERLIGRLPDEKLVFIRITASISPASFPAELSRVAASFLGDGIPCMHLLLDLKVRNAAGESGTIRPYFHAAAPLARRMVQTGVVGLEVYEGEADGLAIGKSGAQMSESLRSHSSTSSASASAGLTSFLPIPLLPSMLSVGGSVRSSSTDVVSDRAVSQSIDTTARQASEERRELVSHTTRVENIISLLSTRYVGTPHLSFSLSPRPLQQLSADPSDPNLWFQQLLARRSSGLEGVQEFTAVIVVPRGTDFCVSARLRRVCLLDSPPGPFTVEERFNGGLLQLARMVNYLNSVYPPGTPLEDLDVDIIGALTGAFRRPVVELWGLRLLESLVVASVVSPGASAGVSARGSANYKHFLEVWLDTLWDEYEREAVRSPLERGLLFGENRFLDTCFGAETANGAYAVTNATTSASPLFRVRFPTGLLDIGGIKTATGARNASTRSRALETVTRWNAIERQMTTLLASGSNASEVPLTASDPKLIGVLVDTWRKLPSDDPRNVDLDQAVAMLKLGDAQRRLLKSVGAKTLADVGAALHLAAGVARHNDDVQRLRALARERRIEGAPTDPIKFAVAPRDVEEMLSAIGSGLAESTPPANP